MTKRDGLQKGPWSANQREFAFWLAIPRRQRIPRTQRELAAKLRVHEHTLSDWKRLRGFTDLVHELAVGVVGLRWPEVLHAMVNEAKKGNVEAAKFVGKVLGRYSDRMEHVGDPARPFIFRIVPGSVPPAAGEPAIVEEPPIVAGELAGPAGEGVECDS